MRTELLHDRIPIHISMVQLAAFNTPQFDWGRNRMAFRPQPVPPVFQPELAARAIEWAVRHQRRELWVGFPVIKTIIATFLMPGIVAKLAARRAWDGQFDREAPPPEAVRPDNLFHPVSGDHGAHGRFDMQAKKVSPALWLTMHKEKLLAAAAVLALGFVMRH